MNRFSSIVNEVDAESFGRDGAAVGRRRLSAKALSLLRRTCEQMAAQPRYLRPDVLSGIHNPFGLAARIVDSWGLLNLCQSPDLLDTVESFIGPDIVLWESELVLEAAGRTPHAAPHHDPALWPIEPLCGVTAHIAIGEPESDAGTVFELAEDGGTLGDLSVEPGEAVVLDVGRRDGLGASWRHRPRAEYLIRYMPARARYNRDPDQPANRRAGLAAPLINYAKRPIWLVRGRDLAGNDFVTGFTTTVGQWSKALW